MTAENIRGGWRVKLYELESSGTWVDHGIGFAYIQLNSTFNGPALSVISESSTDQFLLQSKIQSEDLYEKQGETIILWKEADFSGNIDYALSFQEAEGCSFIWNAINEVQSEYMQQREYGSVPSFSRTQRVSSTQGQGSTSEHPSSSFSLNILPHPHQNDSNSTSAFTVVDDGYSSNVYTILPTDFHPRETFLQQLKLKLESLHPSQRDYAAAQLLHEDCLYFKQLFNIFDSLESNQQGKELIMLAEIFRFILLLNDPSIIEYLLSDEVFKSVAGIFEYDKSLKQKGQYRQFLFSTSQMREIIHLSEEVKVASKFLYRLKYVRDIMLHPTIDDPGITAINSMITFTSGEICSKVMNDEAYMTELFSIIYPNVYQDLLIPPLKSIAEEAFSPSSFYPFEDSPEEKKTTTKQLDLGTERQRFYQQLYQQQLVRLRDRISSSGTSAKRTISSPAQLPDCFHGLLFLRELINLSKFMSYDRRVDLYKNFFAKFKDIFIRVLMFVFHGATKALHYQIGSLTNLRISSNSQSFGSPTNSGNLRSPFEGLHETKAVRSTSSSTGLRQLIALSTANSKASLNEEGKEEGSHNPDDSFEQETVKDNITERQESSSQPSFSEEMGVLDDDPSEDRDDGRVSLEWFAYEELFAHGQSLEAISHMADILSTIAFTFPSLIRQVILEGRHPPPSFVVVENSQQKDNSSPGDGGSARTANENWMENSLLFLLIDNIVNGKEITAIELFGETLKAILDFDKQLNSISLATGNNNQSAGSNSLNPLHHNHMQPVLSNANAVLLNQIKIEKEKFLPYFYDFYMMYLLAPYLDNNKPHESIPSTFYEERGVHFIRPSWQCKYVNGSLSDAHSTNSTFPVLQVTPSTKSIAFLPTMTLDVQCTIKLTGQSFQYQAASRQSSFAIVTSRRLIIEVLTICVLTHSYRIKYFLMKGNYISKIISKSLPSANQRDARQQQKSLQLHAVKFLKSVLMTRDEFYFRHLEKMDTFKPIIALLQALPSKDNLVASSIYDVFEYIRVENLSLLIFYLFKKYGSVFDDLVIYPSVECFDKLKIKYFQLKEHEDNPSLFREQQQTSTVNGEGSAFGAQTRGTTTASSLPVSGRKRHLLVNLTSRNSGKIKKMVETDDEEEYFDHDDDDDLEGEVSVVPLEEDPDFLGENEKKLIGNKHRELVVGGKETNEESLSAIEAEQSDCLILPANKRIRVLSPSSQLGGASNGLTIPLTMEENSSPTSLSPRFLESLKYKTSFPSKPLSPPHYSQRKHGSPLDGETMSPTYRGNHSSTSSSLQIISNNHTSNIAGSNHNTSSHSHNILAAAPTKSDDVFSLLSIYNDQDDSTSSQPLSNDQKEDNEHPRCVDAVNVDSENSALMGRSQRGHDSDEDFLPLAPVRSKFDSEDDEEIVAAVFSCNNTSPRQSVAGGGQVPTSRNVMQGKPKISVMIKRVNVESSDDAQI